VTIRNEFLPILSAAERRAIAKILGRRGGQIGGRSRSPAKIAAARRNAKLGGRPRKKPA
jgi:hypothetical protein